MEKRQLYAAGQAIIPHSGYDENENELLRQSDIAPWAKAEKKPSYSASEVGADTAGSAASALESAKAYADNTYQQATGYTNQAIADLIGGAPTTLDTLKEIADAIEKNENVVVALDEAIGSKASEAEFQSHDANKTVHITASERKKWDNSCEVVEGVKDSLGSLRFYEDKDGNKYVVGADAVPKKLGSGDSITSTVTITGNGSGGGTHITFTVQNENTGQTLYTVSVSNNKTTAQTLTYTYVSD